MLAVRRRIRIVGALPDGKCGCMLFGVRLRRVVSTHWGTRKYMSMDWLQRQDMEA